MEVANSYFIQVFAPELLAVSPELKARGAAVFK